MSTTSEHTTRHRPSPIPRTETLEGTLDQRVLEEVLGSRFSKGSFAIIEDHARPLARGCAWRRRRFGWLDRESNESLGLCINELRVRRGVHSLLEPIVATVHPDLMEFEALQHAYWQTCWAAGPLRREGGRRESRLFIDMTSLTCARVGAPRGPWEDLHELQEKLRRGEAVADWADLLTYMNPTNVTIAGSPLRSARYLPAFRPSWLVQARPDVVAAAGGGYFLNFPEEYEDRLSALHQPIGALYTDGRLIMPPWVERPAAVEWSDHQRGIELLGPENLTLHVEGIAAPLRLGPLCPRGEATVWRRHDGPLPPAPQEGADVPSVVDLEFSGTGLVSIQAPGLARPPIGGAIVRLVGRLAEPWLEHRLDPRHVHFPNWDLTMGTSRNQGLLWALAAGPKLLIDGRTLDSRYIFSPHAAGEFLSGGPPPLRFPYDSDVTRGPRTAIGIDTQDEWVLVVVDGRADNAHSIGMTLEELGRLMKALGCHHALNLDGGGSATMSVAAATALDQLRPDLVSTVVNLPSDAGGRERIVPVSLAVIAPQPPKT